MQSNVHQMLSESTGFCRKYGTKTFRRVFRFTVYVSLTGEDEGNESTQASATTAPADETRENDMRHERLRSFGVYHRRLLNDQFLRLLLWISSCRWVVGNCRRRSCGLLLVLIRRSWIHSLGFTGTVRMRHDGEMVRSDL